MHRVRIRVLIQVRVRVRVRVVLIVREGQGSGIGQRAEGSVRASVMWNHSGYVYTAVSRHF